MKNLKCRINKYPYLLWLTSHREFEIDLDSLMIRNGSRAYSIKKVSLFNILLLKYLPFLVLLAIGISIPSSKEELLLCGIALVVCVLSLFIFIKLQNQFKKYLIVLSFCMYYIIWEHTDLIYFVENILMYISEIILIALIISDIVKKNYQNYYYLADMNHETTIHLAKKQKEARKLLRIPFTEKGIFNVKKGFNINFNFSFGGHYIRIQYEIE